ncbi:MAG: L-rhamnose/proton symporter RhaT [Opitutaceae bacterium]|nr:L-rhamnose/proton symporter RhaT [Opitutaceae bacterium]
MVTASPILGVCLHWLGGLAAGSFYVPFRGVKRWSWETYWLVGGLFSWLLMPWLLALTMTNDLFGVLAQTSTRTLFLTWMFGLLWGVGATTFGLTMRYLGMSLGMGVVLGFCAAFGTLIPPLVLGQLPAVAATTPGRVVLAGVGVCLAGIAVTALAGLNKERELPTEAKQATIKEFNFTRGMIAAVASGVLSAAFAYGLAAAEPIAVLSAAAGTPALWVGLPKLVVVLVGGFTSNALWCVVLHFQRRTGREYLAATDRAGARVPLGPNYLFCAAAGITWYLQFFFYTMGETQMGRFRFSSWTLHMASIIIFSTLWGVALHEWRGTSRRTHGLVAGGIAVLVVATLIVGYGNYLAVQSAPP